MGLAACGTKATEEAPKEEVVEAPPTPEPVTVTVWGWWGDRMKFFQDGGDRFKQKQPNVTVEVVSVAQDLWPKVFASVPAGKVAKPV